MPTLTISSGAFTILVFAALALLVVFTLIILVICFKEWRKGELW